MRERLIEFLKAENKSSAQLAEEIGVQPSGISHILSGRNNPSLDFVLKMLEKFPFLSTDWFLFGTGSMYKDSKMQSLFAEYPSSGDKTNPDPDSVKGDAAQPVLDFASAEKEYSDHKPVPPIKSSFIEVEKIVWFYSDHRFEEYSPGK